MRDGRRANRAQAAEMADRAGEQLVVAEPFEEGAVIVVRAENEAQLVDTGFGLGVQDEGCRRRAVALRRARRRPGGR